MIPDKIRNLPDNPCNDKRIMRDCPDCDGDGELLSDCCGASVKGNGDNDSIDYGICLECRDHCEFTACVTCGGTGSIELNDYDLQNLIDNEAEWLYETNNSEK